MPVVQKASHPIEELHRLPEILAIASLHRFCTRFSPRPGRPGSDLARSLDRRNPAAEMDIPQAARTFLDVRLSMEQSPTVRRMAVPRPLRQPREDRLVLSVH